MKIEIRPYKREELGQIREIWNAITIKGRYFPGDTPLSIEEAEEFFAGQTETEAAICQGEVVGFYILHPNNIGRCAHIANASYGVKEDYQGRGIGRQLVEHSLERAKALGFRGLQYNAVVASNTNAIALYRSLGFQEIGTIRGGYRTEQGFEDMIIFYYYLGA